MYGLSFWRSYLAIVLVEFLHREPARTVGDSFTAFVSGEVIQVLRMPNVFPKFLKKSPWYRGSRPSAPGTRYNRGGPIYSLSS